MLRFYSVFNIEQTTITPPPAEETHNTFDPITRAEKIVADLPQKPDIKYGGNRAYYSVNQSIVHPREVFKTSLLSNAAALILIHQHPTGDPTPSSEDISITRRLKEAGEIMGIKVLDHIIVGDGEYLSFVERGLL